MDLLPLNYHPSPSKVGLLSFLSNGISQGPELFLHCLVSSRQVFHESQFILCEKAAALSFPPHQVACRPADEVDNDCPRSLLLVVITTQTMHNVNILTDLCLGLTD